MKMHTWSSLVWLVLGLYATPVHAAGESQALETEARQRLGASPQDSTARFDLARALTWQQRWDEAQPQWETLLAREPDNPDYLLGMAQVWRGRGKPAQALAPLARARAMAPGYEDVWRAEISALVETGDEERMTEARALREQARAAFPSAAWPFPALDTPAGDASLGRDARVGVHGAPRRTVLELAVSHETLSGGRADWGGQQIGLERHLGDRRVIYGGVEHTRRFGLQDDYVQIGAYMPLAPRTTLQLEGAVSPTHRVRASRSLLAEVRQAMPQGWEASAGARFARYDSGSAHRYSLGLERYLGQHRLGYTLFLGGVAGQGNAAAHRLQWAYYMADRNWIALSTNWGRETEHDGQGLRSWRFAAIGVSGYQELSPHWALIWDVGWHRYRQGYDRAGLRLGVRRTF